ncbi:MAG TPA: MerR family transcriptional regulator [Polyangiaceae bacterium]|nr:MerR family transcriptional regulator [Polyangiaceae bacterium]
MKIGEFSRQLGLSVPTVRYYEALGLLEPPARVSGRRRYGAEALNGLRLVLALKRSGFRLSEIRQLMPLEARARTPERWREIARHKVAELDAQIAELCQARAALTSSLSCDCDGRAERCALVANTTGTQR